MCLPRSLLLSQTLYDQLQENKDKWQEEYDENTKLLHAPPKALDEEDVQFFDEQRAAQEEKERLKKEQAIADLADFRSAQVRLLSLRVMTLESIIDHGRCNDHHSYVDSNRTIVLSRLLHLQPPK